MEIFIHIPHEKRPREVGVFQVVGMDLKESYQFVKTEKPILITQVLGMSDTMYGFTQGALALGGLCGGILTAIVSEKLKIQNSYVLLLICSIAAAVLIFQNRRNSLPSATRLVKKIAMLKQSIFLKNSFLKSYLVSAFIFFITFFQFSLDEIE